MKMSSTVEDPQQKKLLQQHQQVDWRGGHAAGCGHEHVGCRLPPGAPLPCKPMLGVVSEGLGNLPVTQLHHDCTTVAPRLHQDGARLRPNCTTIGR